MMRRVRFQVSDVHTLLDFVDRGLGVAIVPRHVSNKPQAVAPGHGRPPVRRPALGGLGGAVPQGRVGFGGAASDGAAGRRACVSVDD